MSDNVTLHPQAPEEIEASAAPGEENEAKKSAATRLVEIALEHYRLGVTEDGEGFAVLRSGPSIVATLRGSRNGLRALLAREYFTSTGRAASQQALADALQVIDGMAQQHQPEELHTRVANAHGSLWLDLGDNTGRAVKITPDGWEIVNRPPVLFRRTALTAALPEPERGGSLTDLFSVLNVAENDQTLLAGCLVSYLFPDIAHPVLALTGEQGSAKTTTQRTLTACIDPSPVPTRKPPRDADSWTTAAAGSWVVGIDNVSTVPDWLSDSLCRAATGDGDVRRRLYTDGDFHVVAFRRCVILNGIDLGSLRGDLAERLLPIHLNRIPNHQRRGDQELQEEWKRLHARIVGAILDLAAGVAGRLPSVHIESRPRMADFATILAAVDAVRGTNALGQYLGKQQTIATDSLTADPFIQAMQENLRGEFRGTAAELLDRLTVDHPPKGWPATARQATQRLRRQAPSMRKAGWTVDDDGAANHRKVAVWTIRPPERARNADPQSPQDPQTAAERGPQTRNGAGQEQGRPAGDHPPTRSVARSAGHAGHECAPSQDVLQRVEEAIGGRSIDPDTVLALMSEDDLEDINVGAMPARALEHMVKQAEIKR